MNYYLNIISVNDSFQSAIVKHEFPFSNRNILENIGQNTRTYTVQCVFMANPPITIGWGVGVAKFPNYTNYFNFKADLEQARDQITFTHPTLGELEGSVESFSTVNDDTKEFAAVTFTFLQQVSSDESTYLIHIAPEQARLFRLATIQTINVFASLQNAAASLRAFTAAAALFKGKLAAHLNRIVSTATSIKNTIDYGLSLPGEIASAINEAIDRVVGSFVSIRNSPAAFINNCVLGVRQLADIFEGAERDRVFIMGTSRVSYEAALVYQEDDIKKQSISRKEKKQSFDASGNYIGGDPIPDAMTIQELEQTLFSVKSLVYESLLIDRSNVALKSQAKTLQEYINKTKLTRDSMETQETSLQALHTVSLNNGQSYQAAERILKLNPWIKNPTFASGSLKVVVPIK